MPHNLSEPEADRRHVAFTQYLMPNGRTRRQWIELPEELASMANGLEAAGARLEAEMLGDYSTVSFSAELDGADGETETLAIETCVNGPEVPGAVERLIRRAAERHAALTSGAK